MTTTNKTYTKKVLTAIGNVVDVIFSPWGPVHFHRITGSDMDRMRNDVRKVGATMQNVIERELKKADERRSPDERRSREKSDA